MDAAERRSLIADEFIRSFEERTLTFVYQPIVRLEDGHITGAEVLLRWVCPGIGPVNPLVMISVAEEYGLAAKLGEWAMRTACAQNRMWRTQSLGRLRLHLNVSNIELRNVGFAPLLASVCAASGLAPCDVALEVHQMWTLADDLPALAALRDARAIGATIVADDVNAQLADQAWLDEMPVDVIKLNRTFVSDLPNDDVVFAKAERTIAQVHARGIRTIALGIETPAELCAVAALECHEVQGYYFGSPMEINRFTSLLFESNCRVSIPMIA
jgi:EAL domain-containing protein (putative c-di-GMP-specific phosphodiesterase class I)